MIVQKLSLNTVISSTFKRAVSGLFLVAVLTPSATFAAVDTYGLKDNVLTLKEGDKTLTIHALANQAFSVTMTQPGSNNLPSQALADEASTPPMVTVVETDSQIVLDAGIADVHIDKASLQLSYYLDNQLRLSESSGLSVADDIVALGMQLQSGERLYGGGQRVLGMDRRGHKMPLYNRAHYGYTTESNQMYYGLPAVMSSLGYSVIFDNTASGELDIGATNANELAFSAKGGSASYIVVLGENLTNTVTNTVKTTGTQPLPPRWALGNFASRFGYHTRDEVVSVAEAFDQQDIPLDGIVLDLYWFGKDVKGHMGNLDWDRDAFPDPEGMIAQLRDDHINTVVITEPFILSTSKQWESAVDAEALVTQQDGSPYRFDFYFGNTGLVDVFNPQAQDWFWQFYEKLAKQGVAGWWGDLGEPEVHPDDSLHFWNSQKVRGDAVHNAYGHQWAKMVYQGLRELQPEHRPFILMRAGFAGSQRYGMIPWTGDVSRSWGGLQPQVELALQMSVFGLAYTHSDLGGFAGGEAFDPELYLRWLQFGVFSPVFRPHAQEAIAPEPIFHPDPVKSIARDFIKLRYAMLPYNYSLAYQNSLMGLPLMRPLAMSQSEDEWFTRSASYMWGDAFLVSPVTTPHQTEWSVALPPGVWFDFFSGKRYLGDRMVNYPLTDATLPVWVKAGSFVPMTPSLNRTADYDGSELVMHYWVNPDKANSAYTLYDDDGKSPLSISQGTYSELHFAAEYKTKGVELSLTSEGSYIGMPQTRHIQWVIHGLRKTPTKVELNGHQVEFQWDKQAQRLTLNTQYNYQQVQLLTVH